LRLRTLTANLLLALGTRVALLGGPELLFRVFEKPVPTAAPVADYIWDWRDKMEGDFYAIRSEASS
jgi:hypothetical protein